MELFQSAFSSFPYALDPLQHPLAPGINQAHNENENKDDAFENGKHPKLAQSHSPWEQKNGFDIEDQEYERKDVILSFELYPRIPDCFNTALISCLFNGIGFLGSQDPRYTNGTDRNNQPNYNEQSNVNPLTHRLLHVEYVLCLPQ